jgi:hypothetical protein
VQTTAKPAMHLGMRRRLEDSLRSWRSQKELIQILKPVVNPPMEKANQKIASATVKQICYG